MKKTYIMSNCYCW